MAEIHSYIYGIAADATVRRITVSRGGGARHMTLNPPHGSDAVPVRNIVENDRVPLQEAKRVFDLDEAIEVPADLDASAVGEKVRADLEVKAVARQEGRREGRQKDLAQPLAGLSFPLGSLTVSAVLHGKCRTAGLPERCGCFFQGRAEFAITAGV